MTESALTNLAKSRTNGSPVGITSVCSAHPLVLSAALQQARRLNKSVLIEATCNQVNQFGGYTGQTPKAFIDFVAGLAAQEGVPMDRIILGGDHLGPNPWRKEPAETAMAKAEEMVGAYVEAGFSKIHLDASMGCAGEPAALNDEITAERAARLASVAEKIARRRGTTPPCYVIGTEVPIPGGADHALDAITPTSADAARETLEVHRRTFARNNLHGAYERVIALVVQPGVEFGNDNVITYAPAATLHLTNLLNEYPTFVYEAHSTDYQSGEALSNLVQNGFSILKVGPELTFALREAIYALDMIATELVEGYGDRPLAATMEKLMCDEPIYWKSYYKGSKRNQYVERHYSLSDRVRYYWGKGKAQAAWLHLQQVLSKVAIPTTLSSQYLPKLSAALVQTSSPQAIVIASVGEVLQRYDDACACRQERQL
ncbi:tagatose-6-phosphate kinase [Labrys miyagiensis]|uniref:Tagatose-6-phosphate kinase n=1 Tax=Labrys miyagiensis TaxID=346912 RepID=A0ABQ6CDQ2_9HYPH|nr:D-tagatose-bisphosphate aldolase, class II, non-catalytic subunit [Labrys miyagiensis]GLS18275.1 tagatose-6-phosphate kinase [Labrys miyagiensis]